MWKSPRKRHVARFQTQDLATILGVHRNTVSTWIQQGILEPTPEGLHDFLRAYTEWRGRLPSR